MTIQELADQLDDYSGDLRQEVEKLQLEHARGTLGQEEQLDLVGDFRQAVKTHLLQPWRMKTLQASGVALLLLAAWWYMPANIQYSEIFRWVALGLALLALIRAGFSGWTLLKYQKKEGQWLRKAEDTIKQGGTLFDIH